MKPERGWIGLCLATGELMIDFQNISQAGQKKAGKEGGSPIEPAWIALTRNALEMKVKNKVKQIKKV